MFEIVPFERQMRRYDPFRSMEETMSMTSNPFKSDIIDEGDAYVINTEFPGFKKEDIKLNVENDRLTISAERKSETTEGDKSKFVKCERFYGSYSRSFDVSDFMVDQIQASYTDGVLSLRLPKKAEVLPASRVIEIE